jgi:hypothetical protein
MRGKKLRFTGGVLLKIRDNSWQLSNDQAFHSGRAGTRFGTAERRERSFRLCGMPARPKSY